jgi:DNA-binding PadR family transcriptional regulator
MTVRRSAALDPRGFLPLTPLACHVLLALADGGLHGYGIIREVSERTEGLITLRSGTLYTLLQRLLHEGLIAESERRPDPDHDDERRRYYEMTALGRTVLEADLRRLESAVGEGRRKRVLPKAGRA